MSKKTAASILPAHGPWAKGTIATPGFGIDRTAALAQLRTGAMQMLWLNFLHY